MKQNLILKLKHNVSIKIFISELRMVYYVLTHTNVFVLKLTWHVSHILYFIQHCFPFPPQINPQHNNHNMIVQHNNVYILALLEEDDSPSQQHICFLAARVCFQDSEKEGLFVVCECNIHCNDLVFCCFFPLFYEDYLACLITLIDVLYVGMTR